MQDKIILLKLIKSVKNNSKLYKNLSKNNEDDIKEWTAVAQECRMSIAEAQDLWNILLIRYMEYLKNNQEFSLAQHMDFLQPHFFAINDKKNIDELELIDAIGSKNFKETALANERQIENVETNISAEMQKPIQTEGIQKAETEPTTVSENTESKTDATPQDNSITNMSSLELIFLGYAKQLQKMPSALQISTKRKIADIMDEAEIQMLNL